MIVVTGGAGFIGSNLLADLEGADELVVVDRFGDDERWRNVARRELADVVAPEDLPRFLEGREGVRAVLHMGAISSTTERDVDRIVADNVRATLDLLEWCTERRVPLIYASSAATYGDGSAGFDDGDVPAALAELRPLNAYGWSKHVVDRRVARLRAEDAPLPPQCVGLKFFNVYGPNEYHKGAMRSVAHQVWGQARAGAPARLFRSHHPEYQDGGQLRDFVYVKDCCAVMRWLLDHPRVNGLFNLGTGRARSFADLATAVFSALGREPEIEYVPMPEELRERYQYRTEARMERLREAGCDVDFLSLEAGVRDYVTAHLEQPDPYR